MCRFQVKWRRVADGRGRTRKRVAGRASSGRGRKELATRIISRHVRCLSVSSSSPVVSMYCAPRPRPNQSWHDALSSTSSPAASVLVHDMLTAVCSAAPNTSADSDCRYSSSGTRATEQTRQVKSEHTSCAQPRPSVPVVAACTHHCGGIAVLDYGGKLCHPWLTDDM